jgi:hypothetical protein
MVVRFPGLFYVTSVLVAAPPVTPGQTKPRNRVGRAAGWRCRPGTGARVCGCEAECRIRSEAFVSMSTRRGRSGPQDKGVIG